MFVQKHSAGFMEWVKNDVVSEISTLITAKIQYLAAMMLRKVMKFCLLSSCLTLSLFIL
jgi:hypothetical protein